MPVPTPWERLGRRLGQRYLLESVLAIGGMGVLFSARDERSGVPVAVKLLKPHDALDLEKDARLLEEASIIRELDHPSIVRLLDCGRADDGATFLVMELLQGLSLEDELRVRGQLSAGEVLSIVAPVMGALAIAHDHGIVHRDVKPSNIFLAKVDGRLMPKVLDFGIAKGRGGVATRSGLVLGTPDYMSPEHALGCKVGPQADVWSMGVVLYRCLSGVLPLRTQGGILQPDGRQLAVPLADVAPGVSPRLAEAITRALERNPDLRYRDMREFARALSWSATADGVAVPLDPDPLGLPEWGMWARQAKASGESTLRSLTKVPRPSVAVAKRNLVLVAVVGAVAIASAGAAYGVSTTPKSDQERDSKSSPPDYRPASVPQAQAAAANGVGEQVAGCVTPSEIDAQRPAAPPRRSARKSAARARPIGERGAKRDAQPTPDANLVPDTSEDPQAPKSREDAAFELLPW